MKKFFAIILFLLIPTILFAAGSSFKVTDDRVIHYYGPTKNQGGYRVITLAFVADDTDGSVPSLTLNNTAWTDGTNTGDISPALTGWYGYMVEIDCNHAGTEPTEDSELYIYQNGIDLLGGNGVNAVDNTAEREVWFYFSSTAATRPIFDPLTVTVTQQAAATVDATGTIRIILVP